MQADYFRLLFVLTADVERAQYQDMEGDVAKGIFDAVIVLGLAGLVIIFIWALITNWLEERERDKYRGRRIKG